MRRGTARLAALLVVGAAICTASGLASAVPAAPSGPPVSVSVDGEPFSTQPTRSLRGDGLAPGRSVSTVLGVRSGLDEPASVGLQLLPAEGASPALRREVRISVWTADEHGTARRLSWQGPASDLGRSRRVASDLAVRGERWLRVTASVPVSAGNEVADSALDFDLRVALSTPGLGVDAASAGTDGAARSRADGGGALSFTGVPMMWLAASAALLILAGIALLTAIRRRGVAPIGPDRPALSA